MFSEIAYQNKLLKLAIANTTKDAYLDYFLKKFYEVCLKADKDYKKISDIYKAKRVFEVLEISRFNSFLEEANKFSKFHLKVRSVIIIASEVLRIAKRKIIKEEFIKLLRKFAIENDSIDKVLINLRSNGYQDIDIRRIIGASRKEELKVSLIKFAKEEEIKLLERN